MAPSDSLSLAPHGIFFSELQEDEGGGSSSQQEVFAFPVGEAFTSGDASGGTAVPPPSAPAAKPEKKRRRPALSSTAGQAGGGDVPARSAPVTSTQGHSPTTNARPGRSPSSVQSSTMGSASGASTVDALAARVRELEQKLANTCHITHPAEDKLVEFEFEEKEQEEPAPMKGTVSKTRFFGQSHWMNGADMFPNILNVLRNAEVRKIEPHAIFIKCKTLARAIKAHRLKPISSDNLGKTIPERQLANQLVDAYFRTFEGVVRILHGPTFRAEYERYWQNPDAASEVFVMQLQLCMAIGATVYDDIFSLHSAAMQWVHEVQIWLMLPPEKSRMTIAGIQIMCMLVIAKACCAVGQDLTWVSTGSLIRQAMYMGLHRDPKHLGNMSVYRSEMRRRLWATILELNLQSSYDAGGPPLLSSKHYDTKLPANLNDDQLSDEPDSSRQPTSNPEELTDMSVQLALVKSQPLRLAIIKHVNEFRSKESYPETLRLNSELTKACRTLTETLAALSQAQRRSSRAIFNQFHSALIQMFTYRCFLSLHQPMLARSAEDPTYYYSRKVSLDSSLKIAQICGLATPRYPAAPPGALDPTTCFDRLITNGSGVFRIVPVQTLFSIALEFIKKKEEQRESLGGMPSMGCSELRTVLTAAQEWAQRRLRSTETNIKGYCFMTACIALAEAIEVGMSQEEIDQVVIDAGAKVSIRSYDLLKEVAEREGVPLDDTEEGMVPAETPAVESMEGIVDMPFDWMGDLGWDTMGGFPWSKGAVGMPQQLDSVDPSVVSQF
ncbi:uncharacterized protein NECHADRAFT_43226 [Fusarium vanettenii 77-13-4]|uniref:Xylanolytic transcriptional activator regulatory domain-containing protein n=1 Tax=Fusarium vanettenii (strain ATCC MYA-4622 / CBS 123669 / FGSC 9596 / NRRL 45880 / 77-13-4) TaxID=660122 RepID=C7Z8L8_FUSV7|nr:uncharacterized protein NECHADRAFT_43226 [Fusarium vanettenii 77-13-4]EEU38979.1 hypothetical protein NECHADRAFT_43226 [Fusarium vanettenii 77-13-4]